MSSLVRLGTNRVFSLAELLVLGYLGIQTLRSRRDRARWLDQLRIVQRAARELARAATVQQVAAAAVAQAQRVVTASAAGLWLLDPDRNRLRLVAQRGMSSHLATAVESISLDASFATALAARSGRPVMIADLSRVGAELADAHRLADAEGIRGVVVQPLVLQQEVIGVLGLGTRGVYRPPVEQLRLIEALSDLWTASVCQARLHDDTVRWAQSIEAARQQISEALGTFRAVLDATDDGVLMYDCDFQILLVNQRLATWFGVTPEQVVGRGLDAAIAEFVLPNLAEPERLMARLAWRREHPEEVSWDELTQIHPTDRILRYFSGPVRADGRVIGYVVDLSDITELRRQEEERNSLGTVAQALVRELSLDRVGTIVAEQAARALGANAAGLWLVDPATRQLRLLAQQGFSEQTIAALRTVPLSSSLPVARAMATRETIELVSFADVTVSAEWATLEGWQSAIVQPLIARGQAIGALVCLWTVPRRSSPRERALIRALGDLVAVAIDHARLYDAVVRHSEEAEAARQSLQTFLMMVAHDLRGPLTVLLGYAQLLQRRAEKSWSQTDRRGIAGIQKAAQQMDQLVNDLLDAGRIGAGRFEIQPAPTDLVAVAREVLEQQRLSADGHTLILVAPPRLDGLWDRDRLGQLLRNLVSNAIKYSPPGTDVRIEMSQSADRVILCVIDHGVGIAPDQLPFLFQPFSRVGDRNLQKGIGLGLYISKGIVEAHHGRIWVESEVGRGSRFCVDLPRLGSAAGEPAA